MTDSTTLSKSDYNKKEWQKRAVYQVLTDRFSRDDGSTSPCQDISTYCGGTFKGIEDNLDYI